MASRSVVAFAAMPPRSEELQVQVHNDEIIMWQPEHGFCAVYIKRPHEPELILKHHTQTNDHVLIARASEAANGKARELGWIV